MLPPKQAEINIWDTLFVDLIGTYTIPRIVKNLHKLWCLKMINPATGWFEMVQILNKMAAEMAYIADKTWFTRYPLPQQIVFDRGTKFMAKFSKMCQNDYGLKRKTIYNNDDNTENGEGEKELNKSHMTNKINMSTHQTGKMA